MFGAVIEDGTTARPARRLWFMVGCTRCNYRSAKPGVPLPGDLDQPCGLCASPLGSVTVYGVETGAGSSAPPAPLAG